MRLRRWYAGAAAQPPSPTAGTDVTTPQPKPPAKAKSSGAKGTASGAKATASGAKGALRRIAKLPAALAAARADRDTYRGQRDLLQIAVTDAQARLESMVAELHRLRSLGYGDPSRDSDRLSYVFVLTYGRTGSTLLQGLLTRIPGYLVRGENGGIVYQLYRYHTVAMHHRDRLGRKEPLPPTHPWWGIDGYPEDLALREFRHLVLDTVLRPGPDVHTVGFKEIDWSVDDLHDYLDFMRRVFPGARFVVNTRNVADVAASKWWANRPDALDQIKKLDEQVRTAGAHLGDAAYYVHYDDYVADHTTLRGLYRWLGAPWNDREVRAVLAQRHSY
jgi:hypothetical protein